MGKKCSKCKKVKDLEHFYNKKTGSQGKASYCIECDKKYKKEKQRWKTAKAKDTQKRWYEKTRDKNRAIILEHFKELKCERCGITDNCHSFFDLHHIDEKSKEFNIGDMISKVNTSKLKEELAKCTLLCPNCHRREHRCK